MLTMVLDTETDGMVNRNFPDKLELQPHIIQIGAQLYDSDWECRGELNLIVKPRRLIPEQAVAVHGISTGMAEAYGVGIVVAISILEHMAKLCDRVACHNISFDMLVVASEYKRLERLSAFDRLRKICTMLSSTPVLKIPSKNPKYKDYAWPNLMETFIHFTGERFDKAHDAMADVRACAAILKQLEKRGHTLIEVKS